MRKLEINERILLVGTFFILTYFSLIITPDCINYCIITEMCKIEILMRTILFFILLFITLALFLGWFENE